MGSRKCLSQEPRSCLKESAARSCEAVVLSGLDENRAQTADLHRRRDFRLSRSLIHHYEQLPY